MVGEDVLQFTAEPPQQFQEVLWQPCARSPLESILGEREREREMGNSQLESPVHLKLHERGEIGSIRRRNALVTYSHSLLYSPAGKGESASPGL